MYKNLDFPPVNRSPDESLANGQIRIIQRESQLIDSERNWMRLIREYGLPLTNNTGQVSDISLSPGFVYCTNEVRIVLSKSEIERLIFRSLNQSEYLILRKKFGLFFEISTKFYDPETALPYDV